MSEFTAAGGVIVPLQHQEFHLISEARDQVEGIMCSLNPKSNQTSVLLKVQPHKAARIPVWFHKRSCCCCSSIRSSSSTSDRSEAPREVRLKSVNFRWTHPLQSFYCSFSLKCLPRFMFSVVNPLKPEQTCCNET